MNPRKIWPVVALLLMAVGATTAQEKGDPHSMVQVRVEVLTLHDGLPEGAISSTNLVGRRLGNVGSIERDDSGNVVYDKTIDGKSQWLPGNVIKVTLEITENDLKRTETILLEGFEPQTLVLREDPADGRRELLRVIPVFTVLEMSYHAADRSRAFQGRCGPGDAQVPPQSADQR